MLDVALALALSIGAGPFSACSRTTSERATPDLPVYSCDLSPNQAYQHALDLITSSNETFSHHGIGEHLGIPKLSTADACSPTYCTRMVVLKATANQADWIVYVSERNDQVSAEGHQGRAQPRPYSFREEFRRTAGLDAGCIRMNSVDAEVSSRGWIRLIPPVWPDGGPPGAEVSFRKPDATRLTLNNFEGSFPGPGPCYNTLQSEYEPR